MTDVVRPRKLIEVAIPLAEINAEAAQEKSITHGHPATLHKWWARRPLAAARAVLFAQLVNDPGWDNPSPTQQQNGMYGNQRKKLFRIMKELVKWENSDDPRILKEARKEIWKSWRETCEANRNHPEASTLFNPEVLPAGHDPFAGGGAIPLEMQRLGLEAWASDLNPVAVMINKAMIEIPPKVAGHPPINPASQKQKRVSSQWKGCLGLAEDIQYYGNWMREEAFRRIGHLYPKVRITEEMAADRPDLKGYVGQELTVIAYLWARTVKSPNPAFAKVDVPLISTYWLSTKKGKEAYLQPVIEGNLYSFVVRNGLPEDRKQTDMGTKASPRGANFRCILSGTNIDGDYIKAEGEAGRMGSIPLAVVLEGKNRVYLSVPAEMLEISLPNLSSYTESSLPEKALGFRVQLYGMHKWHQLYTHRQFLALSTFSSLLQELKQKLFTENAGEIYYNTALITYLSFVLDKCADYWSSVCSWTSSGEKIRNTFGRQAIPITWDYAETNPFSDSTGNWMAMVDWVWKVAEKLPATHPGFALQADAQTQTISAGKIISTDPPYYDNIGYACLSDYFYYWLRQSLRVEYPELFATMTVPKTEELIAEPARHGSKQKAAEFFLNGMRLAMKQLAESAHPCYPVTIYYAFKQSDIQEEGMGATGWATFLEAVIRSGFSLTGTWPMRTELGNRMRGNESNALASSIVLVCRRRDANAPSISRREFIRELNRTLPKAIYQMTEEQNVTAVDLAQAAIGPGMAVFSKYSGVLEADGHKMTVRSALVLINTVVSAYLDKDDDESDTDTRFCKTWFQQYGWDEGPFGEADTLSRAKGTSVDGLADAGVLVSGSGKVRLLRYTEYPENWDPTEDTRLPIWEGLHHLIKAHQTGGNAKAARLYAQLGSMTSPIYLLATRLYQICEQKGKAEDARPYNELTASWQDIGGLADTTRVSVPERKGKKGKKEDGQMTLGGF
ncbi:MAG TPA: DUF1156 domain-containing protein [Methanocorpusculum sp.]|nr:DUF1156 domain-containing protein [Methanocorpusculum sp.]HJK80763.1 DUF1156 domain-containing protein [Methanocorpusculum sp.]